MTGIGPQIRNMCSTLLSVRKISSFCCPSRGGIDSSSLLKMPSCFFPAVVHVMSILMEIWPEITDHKWRQSRKSLESERHQGNHQRAWLNEQQVTSSSINKNNVYINSCSSEHHDGTFPFSIIFEITFWVFLGIGVFSPTFSRTWHILGKLGFGQSMASTNAGAATGREENSNLGCFFFFAGIADLNNPKEAREELAEKEKAAASCAFLHLPDEAPNGQSALARLP